MGLYSNVRRMATMFCTAIIFATVIMLALRLTVFSDMAVMPPADSGNAAGKIGSQDGEAAGNGDFSVRFNRKIYFAKADAKGNVLISVPDTNKYLVSMDIILPATKESLYYTGALSPGTTIDNAPLSAAGQKLENGEYECIAEISARDPQTLALIDSETQKVYVYIGQKPV